MHLRLVRNPVFTVTPQNNRQSAKYGLQSRVRRFCGFARDSSIAFISFYQKHLSPCLPYGCRFYPSCSEYTKQAILKYGLVRGVLFGLRRLLHCHPFSKKYGCDPLT